VTGNVVLKKQKKNNVAQLSCSLLGVPSRDPTQPAATILHSCALVTPLVSAELTS